MYFFVIFWKFSTNLNDCNGENFAIRSDFSKFISVLTEPYMQNKEPFEKDQNSDTIKKFTDEIYLVLRWLCVGGRHSPIRLRVH